MMTCSIPFSGNFRPCYSSVTTLLKEDYPHTQYCLYPSQLIIEAHYIHLKFRVSQQFLVLDNEDYHYHLRNRQSASSTLHIALIGFLYSLHTNHLGSLIWYAKVYFGPINIRFFYIFQSDPSEPKLHSFVAFCIILISKLAVSLFTKFRYSFSIAGLNFIVARHI